MARVAIVQKAPAFLDRDRSLAIAVEAVDEAAKQQAKLIVFPEAFIPGYPAWIWRMRPGGDMALAEKLHCALVKNSVAMGSDALEPLQAAAKAHGVTVVCGIHELDPTSRGTLYNTAVVIGSDGAVINRHRKVMPTNPERMVWGWGDASGMKVVDTPVGRLGVLICWENYMPLARFALYAQGIDLYVAPTYDAGERWLATMQHIAREGACWVLGSGCAFRGADLPEGFPAKELYPKPDEWVNEGDSIIVAPGGKIAAGPLRCEQGILYAEVDLERITEARRTLDVAGHYSRPDLFHLQVHAAPLQSASFNGGFNRFSLAATSAQGGRPSGG